MGTKKSQTSDSIDTLEKLLPEGTLVCIKNSEGRVESQNKNCIDFCDDQSGNICIKNCMEYFAELQKSSGSQLKSQCRFEDRVFDLVLTKNEDAIISLLFAKDAHLLQKVKDLQNYSLTKQEFLVASLVLKGFNNSEIAEQLFLSKSTVRTHLRHIYRKVPEDIFPKRNVLKKSS